MLVKDGLQQDDAQMRKYYVGMTRAKKGLFIHTDSRVFDRLEGASYNLDTKQYPMPEEIVLQMSYKDVFLDYFKSRKKEILALRSGDSLAFSKNKLYQVTKNDAGQEERGACVVILSVAMRKELNVWKERGFEVVSASVRFIVAWKPKDAAPDSEEFALILPDLKLHRGPQSDST